VSETTPYNSEPIQIHLSPPQVLFEDGCWIRHWQIGLINQFAIQDLETLPTKLSCGTVSINLSSGKNANLEMSVKVDESTSYPFAWDVTFRALLLLENYLGPIETIQGVSRNKWRIHFAITETSGVLEQDKTVLMIAASKGDISSVQSVLKTYANIEINATSPTGMTALMYAALNGYGDIVDFLLQQGADVQVYKGEYTPLQVAVAGGEHLVERFISAGAKVNERNRYGETPIMEAITRQKPDIVKLLLDHNADVTLKNDEGKTALELLKGFHYGIESLNEPFKKIEILLKQARTSE
jgi:hypothetical protein